MKNERVNELLNEFRLKCQEYYICLKFAASGIEEAAERFAKDNPIPTARLWISDLDINDDGKATINKNYASIGVEKYIESSRIDGAFSNEIAKAFVCTIYSLWDETYRNLIAQDAQVDQKKVSADLMGDLRHIRHCIIHSKSEITKEHEKIKVIKWILLPGELIITESMFKDLIDEINKMPVAISRFSSPIPIVQRFYDSLDDKERASFDSWIDKQQADTDIRSWPQWASVTQRMPWLREQ